MASAVGSFTYGQQNIKVLSWGEGSALTIGRFCSIAGDVTVMLGGNHHTDWITTYPFGHINQGLFPSSGAGHPATNGDVVIGNDVWIGMGAMIMSGVTVGDGAVIAANSHVVKSVPAYTIVGGNPAAVIRPRFTPHQIEQLLAIRWWDWPVEKIAAAVDILSSPNVDELIAYGSSV
jgi:acetyltransferase-like isoleucine patch superfamily enzyme